MKPFIHWKKNISTGCSLAYHDKNISGSLHGKLWRVDIAYLWKVFVKPEKEKIFENTT